MDCNGGEIIKIRQILNIAKETTNKNRHFNLGVSFSLQGLGKTIQTIAFLAQMLQDGDTGPHLIIAPFATIGELT
jgi:SNF2 family DNA or RNA helicase